MYVPCSFFFSSPGFCRSLDAAVLVINLVCTCSIRHYISLPPACLSFYLLPPVCVSYFLCFPKSIHTLSVCMTTVDDSPPYCVLFIPRCSLTACFDFRFDTGDQVLIIIGVYPLARTKPNTNSHNCQTSVPLPGPYSTESFFSIGIHWQLLLYIFVSTLVFSHIQYIVLHDYIRDCSSNSFNNSLFYRVIFSA